VHMGFSFALVIGHLNSTYFVDCNSSSHSGGLPGLALDTEVDSRSWLPLGAKGEAATAKRRGQQSIAGCVSVLRTLRKELLA